MRLIEEKNKMSREEVQEKALLLSKDNPYIIKQSQNKFYFSDTFIKIKETAVPIEESSELLQTNIGEPCDGNTEINSECNNFESSYSIEIEPEILE